MFIKASSSCIAPTLLALAFVIGSPRISPAQQMEESPAVDFGSPLVLDLDTAIQQAIDQSWRMKRARIGLQRSTYNLDAVRAALKSNASIDFTLPNFNHEIEDKYDFQTQRYESVTTVLAQYKSTISIRQPLPTDGVISLNGVFYRKQDELIAYTDKEYIGSTFIRFEQPILQPNNIKINIRNAELGLEEAELGFQDEEVRVVREVSRGFFDLFDKTYKALVAAEEVRRLEEAYRIGRMQFDSGIISEVNLLQLEVDLGASRDRASATNGELAREKNDFKQQIGLPLEQEIEVEPTVEYSTTQIDEAQTIEEALQRRTDLQRVFIRREREEMEVRQRRSEGTLQGSISLTLGLDGKGEQMHTFYDSIMDPDQRRGLSINFKLPLWDWGRNRARVNSKLSELEENYLAEEETRKTIQREVQSIVARVREAEGRLALLERSVEAAERSYQLTLEQFGEGEVGVQDFLLTQSRVTSANSSYLNAYLDYERALIDLASITTTSGYGGRSSFGRFD